MKNQAPKTLSKNPIFWITDFVAIVPYEYIYKIIFTHAMPNILLHRLLYLQYFEVFFGVFTVI